MVNGTTKLQPFVPPQEQMYVNDRYLYVNVAKSRTAAPAT